MIISQQYDLILGWRSALLLVFFIHLLVAATILLMRKVDRQSDSIFAAFLIVIAFDLVPQIIGFMGFYDAFRWLTFAPFSNTLLIGPLLYLYIHALTQGSVHRNLWFLLTPGLVYFCYEFYWFLQPLQAKYAWSSGPIHKIMYTGETFISLALCVFAIVRSWLIIRHYRLWLQRYSSNRADFDARWFPFYMIAFSIPIAAWVALEIIRYVSNGLNYFEAYPFYLIFASAAYAMAMGAIMQSKSYFPKMHAAGPENVTPDLADDGPASASIIPVEAIRRTIIDQQLHLEPRLSLSDVARAMASNESYISKAINQGTNKNFNRLINEIRINSAKTRLLESQEDILTLALACGFNSKATFNRVFREITEMTPTQFRNENTH